YASWHQPLKSACVIEQRITTGQKKSIRSNLRHVGQELAGLHLVYAESPAFDYFLVAQFCQSDHRSPMSCFKSCQPVVAVEIAGDVVNPDEIQMAHSQPAETVLYGFCRALFRVVVRDLVTLSVFEQIAFFSERLSVLFDLVQNDSTDFAAEEILRPTV